MEKKIITLEDSEKYNVICVSHIKDPARNFVILLSAEGMPDIKAVMKYEESMYYPDIFYPKTDFRLPKDVELSFEAKYNLMINISRIMTYLVLII